MASRSCSMRSAGGCAGALLARSLRPKKGSQSFPTGSRTIRRSLAIRETEVARPQEHIVLSLRRGEAGTFGCHLRDCAPSFPRLQGVPTPQSPAALAAVPLICSSCGLRIRARVGRRQLSLLICRLKPWTSLRFASLSPCVLWGGGRPEQSQPGRRRRASRLAP
jgi:hypothetical protein